jgi:hypothetical protein
MLAGARKPPVGSLNGLRPDMGAGKVLNPLDSAAPLGMRVKLSE